MDVTSPLSRASRLVAIAAIALTSACGGDSVGPGQDSDQLLPIELQQVASGFSTPLFVTSPPGETTRLFVVERGGLIRIIEGGATLPTPFLDVSVLIATGGGEQGLLGLAFHPDYATNGYFYVNYVDVNDSTRIVRYTVSGDPDVADAASATPVLSLAQPYPNHNGGMLAFGPDGMLYAGLGDGGSGGDPDDNGQSPTTLLGSLLRLDVDAGSPYAIPTDNPFAAHPNYRKEIWAYGLRNPWRFSFDRQTGDLYIADVGQGAREEIDFQPAASTGGENYGWRVMEGFFCYSPAVGCSLSGLTLPVYDYGHGPACSVTGGYVYRGSEYPWLQGRYFFGDYCAGWIRSFRVADGEVVNVQEHAAAGVGASGLSSFGEDGAGELYVVSLSGTVYKLVGIEPTS